MLLKNDCSNTHFRTIMIPESKMERRRITHT